MNSLSTSAVLSNRRILLLSASPMGSSTGGCPEEEEVFKVDPVLGTGLFALTPVNIAEYALLAFLSASLTSPLQLPILSGLKVVVVV